MFFLLLFFILYNFHAQAFEREIKHNSPEYYCQFSHAENTQFLLEATKHNNLDQVKMLINLGAHMNWPKLFDLIDENIINDDILEELFNQYGSKGLNDIFYSSSIKGKATFLMLFAYQGKFRLVELLISKGARVSLSGCYHDALYWAHQKDHVIIAEYLASEKKRQSEQLSCVIL